MLQTPTPSPWSVFSIDTDWQSDSRSFCTLSLLSFPPPRTVCLQLSRAGTRPALRPAATGEFASKHGSGIFPPHHKKSIRYTSFSPHPHVKFANRHWLRSPSCLFFFHFVCLQYLCLIFVRLASIMPGKCQCSWSVWSTLYQYSLAYNITLAYMSVQHITDTVGRLGQIGLN